MTPLSGPSGSPTSADQAQAELEKINQEKLKTLVREAKSTAENEEATAMAGRCKSIRFA
jgi:hypothetical protein